MLRLTAPRRTRCWTNRRSRRRFWNFWKKWKANEIYMKLRQTLDGMRAMGMPLPDDLVRMEKELSAEFKAGNKPE